MILFITHKVHFQAYTQDRFSIDTRRCRSQLDDKLYLVFQIDSPRMSSDTIIANGSEMPSFAWSYGWYISGVNETIMSVAGVFGTCTSCPRALQFSNPNIAFPNTGVPSGSSATAWNARTGAGLAPAMSEFRAPRLTQLIFRGGFEALPIP